MNVVDKEERSRADMFLLETYVANKMDLLSKVQSFFFFISLYSGNHILLD